MGTEQFETGDENVIDRVIDRAGGLYAELQRVLRVFTGSSLTDSLVTADGDELGQLEATAGSWRSMLLSDGAVDERLSQSVADGLWGRFGGRLTDCPAITEALRGSTIAWPAPPSAAPRTLASAFMRREVTEGETLFLDGAVGDSMFVIARGRVRVLGSDGQTILSELGADETVGEMALITGDARRGTVIAVRQTVLYELAKADFERFSLEHPGVMQKLLVTLARRVEAAPVRGRRRATPTNIVIVPAGGETHADDTMAFARTFSEFVQRHVGAELVTAETVEQLLGDGSTTSARDSVAGNRVGEHLRRLEESHDLVLLMTDATRHAWNDRLLGEADLVLIVGSAGNPPALSPIEQELFEAARLHLGSVEIQLVLIESSQTTVPSGTDRWRATRPVELSHHVRPSNAADLGRLARFIVGQACGVTLSGGAVRAFAHIGVLRALEEIDYPIDIVSGTSAGAFVGAQYASGLPAGEMVDRNVELFGTSGLRLLDLTAPITSVIGGRHVESVVAEMFGSSRIEDLWKQFICTSTDLTAAAMLTHRTGDLSTFLLASAGLPALLPPVVVDGHLLVDGGVMSNLPVTPLLETTNVCALVAASVSNDFYNADEDYNYTDLSPRQMLLARLNPFGERLVAPSVPAVVLRSLEIGATSVETSEREVADVLITPDVGEYGYTNVSAIPEIADRGYQAAVDALARWDQPAIPFN